MSLFGSLMADAEDDPFFGSHMRQMRTMNNMMNSLFSDPFGMLGGSMGSMLGGPLAIGGPQHGGMNAMMPFMPQMPSFNGLFDLSGGMGGGMSSSFSSSTMVMSRGPNGTPQVYSSSSSTKIGPNGIKETRKTLQDSRTGTKKMSIGHHIGERAHVIEREQNVYSGDAEETQEFINIEEEDAEDFDREFQQAASSSLGVRPRLALGAGAGPPRGQLALPAPPPRGPNDTDTDTHTASAGASASAATNGGSGSGSGSRQARPAPRRPLRGPATPSHTTGGASASVREVYAGSHPSRHRHKAPKSRHSGH